MLRIHIALDSKKYPKATGFVNIALEHEADLDDSHGQQLDSRLPTLQMLSPPYILMKTIAKIIEQVSKNMLRRDGEQLVETPPPRVPPSPLQTEPQVDKDTRNWTISLLMMMMTTKMMATEITSHLEKGLAMVPVGDQGQQGDAALEQ